MAERTEYTPEMQAKAVRVMAANLAEQLGEALDQFLARGMTDRDGQNLMKWLWYNKVGILQSLQSCSEGESENSPHPDVRGR